MTAVRWLAEVTGAEVDGLEVGSHTLEFRPSDPPTALRRKVGTGKISIVSGSGAASALLIFQAVFPFLLFAGGAGNGDAAGATIDRKEENEDRDQNQYSEPIELEIHGGTNVSFSPSWEYVDQVLLPALEDIFGLGPIERRLERRRWAQGSAPDAPRGTIYLNFRPIQAGQTLKPSPSSAWARASHAPNDAGARKIHHIDATVLAPASLLEPLQNALALDLETLFPGAETRFAIVEDSGHASRVYVLLVAVSETGVRWGRDFLNGRSTRGMGKKGGRGRTKKGEAKEIDPEEVAAEISQKVGRDLRAELDRGGVVDEYLQDQLVVFQALAEGQTDFTRGVGPSSSSASSSGIPAATAGGKGGMGSIERSVADMTLNEDGAKMPLKKDKKTHEPFGEGSTHTTTARWVASSLLPTAQWFNRGAVCEGAGVSFLE